MAQPLRNYDSYERFLNEGRSGLSPAGRSRAANRPKTVRYAKKRSSRDVAGEVSVDIAKGKKSVFLRVVGFVSVFSMAFLIVFSIAYTETRKHELIAVTNRLAALIRDNNALRSENHGVYSLAEVEAYAINVLGMVHPEESHIIHLQRLPVDFTVRHEVYEDYVHFRDVVRDMFNTIASLFRTEG